MKIGLWQRVAFRCSKMRYQS